ncbi:hypothetical protein [Paenibacillus sp. FSL H8-0537]|uniref:hypothetical protein n=1 Tax=Paenibacillus sp. FSL H8-0537 TaxID=2921399 RepID=UPI003101882B
MAPSGSSQAKEQQQLPELLLPVRLRLTMFTMCKQGLKGLLIGSSAGLLLLVASRLWPLLHARPAAVILAAAGLLAGLLYGLWRRASLRDAARAMDRHDTDDAVSTALDGWLRPAGQPSAIVLLQRQEAIAAAKAYAAMLSKRLPWPAWPAWKRSVLGVSAVWAISALLLVWANPLDHLAEERAAERQQLEELREEAAALAEEAERADVPEEAKRQLAEPLEKLRSKLEENDSDIEAALAELAEAMRELEQTAEQALQSASQLDEAAEAMQREPALKQLGAALQDRLESGMSEAISDMRSELHKLTPEQKEQLAQALEQLAGQLPQDKEALASALAEAAEQARNPEAEGDASGETEGGDGLAALEEALAGELSQAQLEQLASAMASQLGQSGQPLAGQLAASGGSVPPSWAAAASGNGSPSGSSAGGASGSPSEPGSGAAPGSSGASGSGEPSSSGAGTGAGASQGAGAGAGSGQGQGAGSGQGGLQGGTGAGGRTLVTTPRTMAGEGNVQEDGGPSTGGQEQTGGKSPMIDGTTRPYEEVYSEYATEAKKALGRSQLPQAMQDKVKQYFDNIQPNR